MTIETILAVVGSAIVTGVFSVVVNRLMARSSAQVAQTQADVEHRKVDQATFDRAIQRLDEDRMRLTRQLDELQGLFALAMDHIQKSVKAAAHGKPMPALPPQLRIQVLYWDDDKEE